MMDYATQERQARQDQALAVTFEVDAEGVERIRIPLGRDDEVFRKAEPADRERFADQYEAFKAGQQYAPGTPLSELLTPSEAEACRSEGFRTVQQLLESPDERLGQSRLPLLKMKYDIKHRLRS